MAMQQISTPVLKIAYEIAGPPDGPAVLLLHGWPDDIRAWRGVAPSLHAAGLRTIIPFLRGCGETAFLSDTTIRDGRAVALAQDAIDLANGLGIQTLAVAGHDWGSRAAYTLAALFPERITHVVGIALSFQPRGEFKIPSFPQARRFWYQWFMALDRGAEAVRADPTGFARIQWDTWSPSGWFDNTEFEITSRSFANPDWVDVTLNAYRTRWRSEITDPRYDHLQQKLKQIETLATPTVMIQGGSDFCDGPAESEGMERFFTAGYQRIVLDGVGHFPPRESPAAVSKAILAHLSSSPSPS